MHTLKFVILYSELQISISVEHWQHDKLYLMSDTMRARTYTALSHTPTHQVVHPTTRSMIAYGVLTKGNHTHRTHTHARAHMHTHMHANMHTHEYNCILKAPWGLCWSAGSSWDARSPLSALLGTCYFPLPFKRAGSQRCAAASTSLSYLG